MRRRLTIGLVVAASLAIPTVAAATILPVTDTTVVQVETGQLGYSQYKISHYLDGSTLREVRTAGGQWTVKTTGVTVTPELDGTFTFAWPCPSTVADTGSVRIARTPANDLVVVQAGTGWSFEFTSTLGQHTVVPNGACGARVVRA